MTGHFILLLQHAHQHRNHMLGNNSPYVSVSLYLVSLRFCTTFKPFFQAIFSRKNYIAKSLCVAQRAGMLPVIKFTDFLSSVPLYYKTIHSTCSIHQGPLVSSHRTMKAKETDANILMFMSNNFFFL